MSEFPWDDPDHDVMADIGDFLRREYEKWPVPPFEPILPEWLEEMRRGI